MDYPENNVGNPYGDTAAAQATGDAPEQNYDASGVGAVNNGGTGADPQAFGTTPEPPADYQPAEAVPDTTFADGSEIPQESYASDEEAIVDINQLDMQSEPMADVDMDKLEESMEYAPTLAAGQYFPFIFRLSEEKPWQAVTMKGKPEAQFNYEALHIKEDGTTGKTIRFQRANTFRSGKMEASRAEELLFALGKMPAFKASERKKGDILRLLQEASAEQIVFKGQVHWRHYDKATGVTTSTAPAKPYKKVDKTTGQETTVTEQPWPRDEHGKFARHPGNEDIHRVAPTKETLEASKAQRV